MAITWLMEWRIRSSWSLSLVLGRTTGAEVAWAVAAALLTSSITGPAILWAAQFGFSGWIQLIPRQAGGRGSDGVVAGVAAR